MTVPMQPHSQRRPAPGASLTRRGMRAGAVSAGVVLGSWVVTAVAAPPQGWENPVNDSVLVSMLKLLGIPLLVIAVVTLLGYLPLMMHGGRKAGDSASYFAEHSEWFGGPRDTPELVAGPGGESRSAARGGASARF